MTNPASPPANYNPSGAPLAHIDWAGAMPAAQWQLLQRVSRAAQARGLRFAMGGAFAVAVHTGHWRNTKDLDYYVLPEDRRAMIDLLLAAGLQDYHGQEAYDRAWIFRAALGENIVDVIWAMANQRAEVDEGWLTRGPLLDLRGLRLRPIPPEETIWAKLYVFQRERFDWPDALNIIHAFGASLDWPHLLGCLSEDRPLLAGLMSVYAWLCPGLARQSPADLWPALGLAAPPAAPAPAVDDQRVTLLDSRPWFGAGRAESGG